jgi:4-aminobutyrate aminotransferase-like enzyme
VTPGFSISRWHDTDEILARLQNLLDQPTRPIRPGNMQAVLEHFETRCVTSKRVAEEAARAIPGGVQHNLAFNSPHPLAIRSADGAHLTDVDGNRYIDFLQGGGATLLGSSYAPVREKVRELLEECGPLTGLMHEYEVKLARELTPGAVGSSRWGAPITAGRTRWSTGSGSPAPAGATRWAFPARRPPPSPRASPTTSTRSAAGSS